MLKWMAKLSLGALLVLLVMGTIFADDVLVVRGLYADDLEVSVEFIENLPQHTEDVTAVTSGGQEDKYTVTGSLLSDLLEEYGKKQEDILGIRLIASDGYAIDVTNDILKERQIILTYLINGASLQEDAKPLQVTIPDERAMYWVRSLAQIEIVEQMQVAEVKKIRFLESIAQNCTLEDYVCDGDVAQAIKIEVMLDDLGLEQSAERIKFKAADGFEKNETYAQFLSSFIRFTGVNAPLFTAPELPEGMQIKNIVFFILADNAFVSLTQGLKYYDLEILDDVTGISLADLISDLGIAKGAQYRLTALDGYAVDVLAADLTGGYIYLDDLGNIHSYFPHLPKNTSVRGLDTIEVFD